MNAFKVASVLSFLTTFASAWPHAGFSNSSSSAVPTTYACNPAHSYPAGASCISTAGSLTLVYPTAWATTTKVFTTTVTTYCPTPTTVTIGTNTITVTKATTLTVPCPTTTVVSKPIAMAVPTTYTTSTTVYTTIYTTVCPTPTVVTVGQKVITVTSATTLRVPVTKTAVVTMPVQVAPASSAKTQAPPASSAPVVVAPPASSAPVVAPPASSAPAVVAPPASSAPAVVTCPAPQTVTVTQYVTVSKQQETSKAPTMAPPATSAPPATTQKPASSAAASSKVSSAPASSAPASSKASSAPAASSSAPAAGKKCPLELKAGSYEYPHGLQVNGVNGYNLVVDRNTKTNAVFDIPQADAGKTCSTYFALPNISDLETTSYKLATVDGAKINVTKDGKVISSFAPVPNNAYLIESGPCAAGKSVAYTFSTGDSLTFNGFNDYNRCALGVFVTVN